MDLGGHVQFDACDLSMGPKIHLLYMHLENFLDFDLQIEGYH